MSALQKTIHVACRDLGIDADTRHALQLRLTGKASLADMSAAEQTRVLEALKAQGFKPSAGAGRKKGHRQAAARGDLRFAYVLWGKLVKAGVFEVAGAKGLNAFVRASFEGQWGSVPIDIDQMRDHKQIATIIETLKDRCKRAKVAF